MRYSIAMFATLVALTGCGGGDDTGSPSAASPAATTPAGPPVALTGTVDDHGTGDATGGTLDLAIGDSYFAPTYVKAAPGSAVTLTLKNGGAMPHTFTVASPKVDVTVAAGGTGVASLTMPASGALAFYCRFHRAAGMQGALFGTPGDAVTGSAPSGDDGGAYGQ